MAIFSLNTSILVRSVKKIENQSKDKFQKIAYTEHTLARYYCTITVHSLVGVSGDGGERSGQELN